MNRSPVRLIALDLDGTLLDSRKQVCPASQAALAEAGRRGVAVVLASARPPRGVRDIYHRLGLATPQVNYNGALVWDEPGRRVLEHRPMSPEVWGAVLAAGRNAAPEVQVACEILDAWYTDRFDPRHLTETGKSLPPDVIAPIALWRHLEVTKLMFLGPEDEMGRLYGLVAGRFPGVVSVVRTDPHLIQVMAAGVNKAGAVRGVAAGLGVGMDAVLAIGDGANDIELLRESGWSAAVANAHGSVRASAGFVAPSHDDGGVAAALRWAGVVA